ncbi:MAG: DUF190 domain-containing protein [Verrucomicrobia bacterium]|nr:DUF190 domain-containing protein [Verrucomicrobiota bacterium]
MSGGMYRKEALMSRLHMILLRGPLGYGKSSRPHTARILGLSMNLPLVIEMVDTEAKIQAFLPILDGMIESGLVTLEKVKVIDYRATPEAPAPEAPAAPAP